MQCLNMTANKLDDPRLALVHQNVPKKCGNLHILLLQNDSFDKTYAKTYFDALLFIRMKLC